MFATRIPFLAPVLSVLGLLVVGAAVILSVSLRVHAADAGDSKLKTLRKEKLSVLREVAAQTANAYRSGSGSLAEVLEANQAAGHAELDLCDTDKERLAVLEKMLAEAKGFEASVAERVKAGESPIRAVLQAKVSRLEIEIALEHVKGK